MSAARHLPSHSRHLPLTPARHLPLTSLSLPLRPSPPSHSRRSSLPSVTVGSSSHRRLLSPLTSVTPAAPLSAHSRRPSPSSLSTAALHRCLAAASHQNRNQTYQTTQTAVRFGCGFVGSRFGGGLENHETVDPRADYQQAGQREDRRLFLRPRRVTALIVETQTLEFHSNVLIIVIPRKAPRLPQPPPGLLPSLPPRRRRHPLSGHRRLGIAVDLSDESAYAVRWAVQNYIRPNDDDAVILLHVRPTSVLYGADWGFVGSAAEDADEEEAQKRRIEEEFDAFTMRKLGEVAEPLVEARISFKMHVVKDHDMKERLCLEVERLGLSVVIMGSRGLGKRTGKGRLGSVSDYCVHHCVCPVVVVRVQDGEGAGAGAPEVAVVREAEVAVAGPEEVEDRRKFEIVQGNCFVDSLLDLKGSIFVLVADPPVTGREDALSKWDCRLSTLLFVDDVVPL
ncbi:hypothetical protein Syun_010407 [Stephania yunnanensis]|uniref:UspA domain-containing protein n=1 Tax=Stephania yunnanensis TaxID=152371 RepID=A0AAP0KGG4_9MAGN